MESCRKKVGVPDQNITAECKFDIGVGSFTVTNARTKRADFVSPFGNEAHRAIARAGDGRDNADYTFFLRTFTAPVWAAICALIFYHALGTYFLFGGGQFEISPRHGNTLSRLRAMIASLQVSFVTLFPKIYFLFRSSTNILLLMSP